MTADVQRANARPLELGGFAYLSKSLRVFVCALDPCEEPFWANTTRCPVAGSFHFTIHAYSYMPRGQLQ